MRPFTVTHRGVFAIAVPMTLAYLTTPLVGIVNLGAVGRLGDPALVGGVSIGALAFDIVFGTFSFLRSGTTGLVAQAAGAEDQRAVAANFYRACALGLAIGLAILLLQVPLLALAQMLIGGSDAVRSATADYWHVRVLSAPLALANFVVLGWLIGLGRAGAGLAVQIVLNGVNIVLSVVLVHAFGLGVAGVGWASVAAEAAALVFGATIVARLLGDTARLPLAEIFQGQLVRRMFAVNGDIMIRTLALMVAFAFFTAESARAGDVVLAANEILLNLTMFAAYFLDGLAAAAEQLAGRALGARHRPAFERALKLTVGWGFVVGAAGSIVFLLAGALLIDAMSTSDAVRATARHFLPLAALVPVAGTLAYQMDGVFIGATWTADMRNFMLLALAIYLLTWWALAAALGITGLWIALLVFVLVRGVTLLWRARTRVGLAFQA